MLLALVATQATVTVARAEEVPFDVTVIGPPEAHGSTRTPRNFTRKGNRRQRKERIGFQRKIFLPFAS